MINEEELWLELYKFISSVNEHLSLEITNTYWESPSIKLSKRYVTVNWATLDDEWETGYIESDCHCSTLIDCLVDVINKLKKGDWVY